MTVQFQYNGTNYPVELPEKIAATMPKELCFQRSENHEFYARLYRPADTGSLNATALVRRGGVYYFAGWNALSLVYRDKDIAPFQVTELGRFPEALAARLENAPDRITLQLEVTK